MSDPSIAGRSYPSVYRVSGKRDIHDFLCAAVAASGATLLHASTHTRAPVYLGISTAEGTRIGALVYPFRCNPPPIANRPKDEHRVQIRYGAEKTWFDDHSLAHDPASVDVTAVVGVHLDAGCFVGLDPQSYDPLPMGISIEFKDAHVDAVAGRGWHVWERENRPGRQRDSRSGEGLETIVGFAPEQLVSYLAFEQRASELALDQPLRYHLAQNWEGPEFASLHRLEEEFDLTSRDILELISMRPRLKTAVRGGVAERHLQRHLDNHPDVRSAQMIEKDAQPDFLVEFTDGSTALIECKNVSPETYADGLPKVEVQKTRSQKLDDAGRFYRPEQFDLVAACLFAVTGRWEFRFKSTVAMPRHDKHPDRLAVYHRIDDTWSPDLSIGAAPH